MNREDVAALISGQSAAYPRQGPQQPVRRGIALPSQNAHSLESEMDLASIAGQPSSANTARTINTIASAYSHQHNNGCIDGYSMAGQSSLPAHPPTAAFNRALNTNTPSNFQPSYNFPIATACKNIPPIFIDSQAAFPPAANQFSMPDPTTGTQSSAAARLPDGDDDYYGFKYLFCGGVQDLAPQPTAMPCSPDTPAVPTLSPDAPQTFMSASPSPVIPGCYYNGMPALLGMGAFSSAEPSDVDLQMPDVDHPTDLWQVVDRVGHPFSPPISNKYYGAPVTSPSVGSFQQDANAAAEEMERTISNSYSVSTGASFGIDTSTPVSCLSGSALVPMKPGLVTRSAPVSVYGETLPSHAVRPTVPGVPNEMLHKMDSNPMKRTYSNALPDATPEGRGKKRCPTKQTCAKCYLAHKHCDKQLPCQDCRDSKGQFPVCVTKTSLDKNIFLDCLSGLLKTKAADIIKNKALSGRPATQALSMGANISIDFQSGMMALTEYKLGQSRSCARFFDARHLQKHPFMGPFYQASMILQARGLFKNEKRFTFVEDDLLVARAVCGTRALRFLEKNMEKNNKQKNMTKGSTKARNMVVCLAIVLEQVLAFDKTSDEALSPAVADKRWQLAYNIAYQLRHMAKATFENSNLFEDVDIGPDNSIRLKSGFWTRLNTVFPINGAVRVPNDGDDGDHDDGRDYCNDNNGITVKLKGSPNTPSLLVQAPTFHDPPHRPWRRHYEEDYNEERDGPDAQNLLAIRVETEDNVVSITRQLEAMEMSPPDTFLVGRSDKNFEWQMDAEVLAVDPHHIQTAAATIAAPVPGTAQMSREVSAPSILGASSSMGQSFTFDFGTSTIGSHAFHLGAPSGHMDDPHGIYYDDFQGHSSNNMGGLNMGYVAANNTGGIINHSSNGNGNNTNNTNNANNSSNNNSLRRRISEKKNRVMNRFWSPRGT